MADEIISRAEARARGLKRYFPGSECKYGHVSERLVSSGVCIICRADIEKRYNASHPEKLKAKRRSQAARHRAENPDRIKKNQKNWRNQNPEAEYSRVKKWRAKNPDKAIAQSRRFETNHRDARREKHRKWYESNRLDDQYKQKAIERTARWIAENPEKKRELARKGRHTRRARQYEAGGSYTNAEINALLEKQIWLCAEVTCRADLREGKELDHYIPVSKGGRNDIGNLQWLCVPCNRQKRDMMPDEWAKHRQQQREKGKIP